MCVLLGVTLYLLIGGLERGRAAPIVTGIILLPVAVALVALFLALLVRPVVVDTEALRIPVGLWRRVVVPLADLSGIGLIYRRQSRSAGWWLEIWDGAGNRRRINGFLVARDSPRLGPAAKGQPDAPRDCTIPRPDETRARLASSKPGRLATHLYQAAIARQGPRGPLTTQARQTAVRYDGRYAPQAWWSPDGTLGLAEGLRPPDPTSRATAAS
jgi:hypothetical protein